MKLNFAWCASILSLLAAGFCVSCNSRTNMSMFPKPNDERTWYATVYDGKSPEEILEVIRKAEHAEEMILGLDALTDINLHYKKDDNYERALESIKAVYEISQSRLASLSLPVRNPTIPGISDYDYWNTHHWSFGDVVAEHTYYSVYAIAKNNKKDARFFEECREFYESIQPPDSKPELSRLWNIYRKPFLG